MSHKTSAWLVGLLLWLVPSPAVAMVHHIVSEGGSWWWWVPAIALALAHSVLLDLYVRESYLATIHEDAR